MWARLAVVPLIGGAGLVGPAAPAAVAAPAAAVTQAVANELYVSSKTCTPGGDGSVDTPFCTISAAVAVAQAGQTVLVHAGHYPEAVSFTRSGVEGAPVTFRAVNSPDGSVAVGNTSGTVTGAVFTLAGVHDIAIEGFRLVSAPGQAAVVVDGSDRVTIDGVGVLATRPLLGAVQVTGDSDGVTVSRSYLGNTPAGNPGLAIDAGVTGVVVSGNQFSYSGLRVTDAPGTVITNNTFVTNCVRGIDVTGASTGVSIENNIVRTNRNREACSTPANATAIAVSTSSVPGTVLDYNLIDPITGGALYSWGDTTYQDLAVFRQATGQGAHDIVADPLIGFQKGSPRSWFPLEPNSPAVDSGNASAKGVARTDMLGNPRTDNPGVANTGSGTGYHDRGAIEVQGGVIGGQIGIQRQRGNDPLAVTAMAAPQYAWPTDGDGGSIAYKFGDEKFWRVTDARTLDHSFRRGGLGCVLTRTSFTGFRAAPEYSYSHCTTVGALYTPVAPTRLLDTRAAIGTATTTAVPPKGEVVLPVPNVGGVLARDITALVLNVTVTRPTASGFITVYPDGTPLPGSSNVNFVANETVPNLVTVPMGDSIRFRNSSSGTVHLVADLQGFHGRQGSGFKPLSPVRVLDTRTSTPLTGNGDRRLDFAGRLPADATAAILNVTVTKPTAAGVLKVYPDGSPVPVASNLNFVAGQTIPNLVIVPVVAGKVMIRNASSGTTHVVADLAGYFGSGASGANQVYVPYGPTRIADTRDDSGWIKAGAGPLSRYQKAPFAVKSETGCDFECPRPTAAVLNLTVTAPTAAGVLTGYPADEAAPTASNVNFVAGETASNLAVVKVGANGQVAAFNNSSGSTHAIVDQSGYFIAPA